MSSPAPNSASPWTRIENPRILFQRFRSFTAPPVVPLVQQVLPSNMSGLGRLPLEIKCQLSNEFWSWYVSYAIFSPRSLNV